MNISSACNLMSVIFTNNRFVSVKNDYQITPVFIRTETAPGLINITHKSQNIYVINLHASILMFFYLLVHEFILLLPHNLRGSVKFSVQFSNIFPNTKLSLLLVSYTASIFFGKCYPKYRGMLNCLDIYIKFFISIFSF